MPERLYHDGQRSRGWPRPMTDSMFSTMASLPLHVLLEQLGTHRVDVSEAAQAAGRTQALPLGWSAFDALMPDGGLPRAAVVELAAPRALGGATMVAMRAVRAAQERDPRAWCAWIDPDATLYGPGLARAGIDLSRLLVVRPPRAEIGRTAVKVVASQAFDVVVADVDPIEGAAGEPLSAGAGAGTGAAAAPAPAPKRRGTKAKSPEVIVRKLALAAEESGTTVVLVTDASRPRHVTWPVALRLELARRPQALAVRVAKDRGGRMAPAKTWLPLVDVDGAVEAPRLRSVS